MAVAAGESQKQPGHPRGSVERRWWSVFGGHKDPDTHGEDGQVTWGHSALCASPPRALGTGPWCSPYPHRAQLPACQTGFLCCLDGPG